jgi:hypothetical protein
MLRINIKTIPHKQQRLGGFGDWFFVTDPETNEEILEVRVSNIGDWRMEFLFARHEMDEALICKNQGISTKMVDADEKKASPKDDADSFSGYDEGRAWVQFAHNCALAAEWVMSGILGINWRIYGERCREAGWHGKG